MKLLISFVTAVSLGLTCTVLGDDNYTALAAQGYRWVTVNGPYASYVLDVPCFRHSGGQLVFGGFGMVIWRVFVLGILE